MLTAHASDTFAQGSMTTQGDKEIVGAKPSGKGEKCGVPDRARCLSKGYLDSACGRKHKALCGVMVQGAFKSFYDGLPVAKKPLLRAACAPDAAAMRPGKAQEYTPRAPITNQGGVDFVGRSISGRAALSLSGAVPVTAHRTPAWDANGTKITSCEEYAYERYYDWNRYLDAMAACKGDINCRYDVAFRTDVPGLRRDLRRKAATQNGGEIFLSKVKPRSVVLPKNAFYELGDWYVRDADGKLIPGLEALAAELRTGESYYGLAPGVGTRSYADPWAFMADMRQKNNGLDPEMREEYQRRKRHLSELIHRYENLEELLRLKHQIEHISSQKGKVAGVSELLAAKAEMMQARGSLGGLRSMRDTPFKLSDLATLQALPASAKLTLRNKALLVPTSQQMPPPPIAPMMSVGTTPPPGGSSSQPQTDALCPAQTTTAWMCAEDDESDDLATLVVKAHCRITAFLKEEWDRKQRGAGGCLDRTRTDCDWSIWDGMNALVDVPSETSLDSLQQADFEFCKAFAPQPMSYATHQAAKQALEQKRAQLAAVLREVPQLPGSTADNVVVGMDLSDSKRWGDAASWSAAYGYKVYFELKAHKKQQPDGRKTLCQLQGKSGGAFNASITTPIDDDLPGNLGNALNQLIDADAWLRVNMSDSGQPDQKGRARAKLIVLGQQIFDTKEQQVSFAHALSEQGTGSTATPKLAFSVMVGPIPINVSAWAEFVYGAGFTASTRLPDANQCTALYEAKASFVPSFDANGVVKVSAGIEGFLSIGIRGDITLVDIDLPISVVASLVAEESALPEAATNLGVVLDLTAQMELSSLDGRLRLIIDYIFDTYRKTIFSWEGYGPTRFDLMKPVRLELPLTAFN